MTSPFNLYSIIFLFHLLIIFAVGHKDVENILVKKSLIDTLIVSNETNVDVNRNKNDSMHVSGGQENDHVIQPSKLSTVPTTIHPFSVDQEVSRPPPEMVTDKMTRFSNIPRISSSNRNFMNHHASMKGSNNPPIRLSALRPAALMAAGSTVMNNHGTAIMAGAMVGHGHTMREAFVDTCGFNVRLHDRKGRINSPNYPFHWGNRTSCTWIIVGQPKDIVTVSFDDLDIDQNESNECPDSVEEDSSSPVTCCQSNYVKIGDHLKTTNKKLFAPNFPKETTYCGKGASNKLLVKVFVSTGNEVTIKFHASSQISPNNSTTTSTASPESVKSLNRGFHLTYYLSQPKPELCKSGHEFRCKNGKCIPTEWKCNRRDECGDNSDESNCDDVCSSPLDVKCDSSAANSNYGSSSANYGSSYPSAIDKFMSQGCYSFPTERCDNIWNCDNGADERGCGGCPINMFMCPLGRDCYSESKRCDGSLDCRDFTDELNCGFCGPNRTLCDPTTSLTQCYDPFTERCDHRIDCPNGADEKGCLRGCEDKILCVSGTGCYSQEERCNGIPDCSDYSDEKNCSLDLCRQDHGSYLCANRRCIRSQWVCDRSNDCGDATDEINCLKNSVITAAIMGSLVCGLLLVIAISCTCKLIALRSAESTFNSSGGSQNYDGQRSSSCSRSNTRSGASSFDSDQPLFRIEPSDYLYREPPPSYAAAVGAVTIGTVDPYDQRSIRRQQRRLRRHHRRRPPSPPPGIDGNQVVVGPNGQIVASQMVNGQFVGGILPTYHHSVQGGQAGQFVSTNGQVVVIPAAPNSNQNTSSNSTLPPSALNNNPNSNHSSNLNELFLNGHQLVINRRTNYIQTSTSTNNLNIPVQSSGQESSQDNGTDHETTLDGDDDDDAKPMLDASSPRRASLKKDGKEDTSKRPDSPSGSNRGRPMAATESQSVQQPIAASSSSYSSSDTSHSMSSPMSSVGNNNLSTVNIELDSIMSNSNPSPNSQMFSDSICDEEPLLSSN